MNFWESSAVCQQTQPFITGSAHFSKHRVWPILISRQDVNFRPSNYATEYPAGQSRQRFSSSCPKSWALSQHCPKSSQDRKDPAIPSRLSQCQIVIDTGFPPGWPWLTETKRDPSHVGARRQAGAAAGLGFEGQGAHTGQWGYTNMQSIYF